MNDSLYSQPVFYRMLFSGWNADLPFYAALADRCGGPVLECGVGTGRVALELVRRGHRVHGIDNEPAMVGELRTGAPEGLTVELADARSLSLGRRFALVLAPFNLVSRFLEDGELEAFLDGVRRHLEPSGLFAFDVWLPDVATLTSHVAESPRFPDPRTGRPTRCTERHLWDGRVLRTEMTLTPAEDPDAEETLVMRFRVREPHEIEGSATAAGFEIVHVTRSFSAPGEPEREPGDLPAYVLKPRAERGSNRG